MKKHFIIHRRLLDVLQFYRTTFIGFCELINNSLQAQANDIQITVVETPQDEVSASPIQRIIVRDNGTGVPPSEITPRLLHVATDVKPEGKGVGRFAALQIGKVVKITTVGKEASDGSKHETKLAFSSDELNLFTDLASTPIDVDSKSVGRNARTFYQVDISELYSKEEAKGDSRKRICKELLPDNLPAALFEQYSEPLFTGSIRLSVNDKLINAHDFVEGEPKAYVHKFTDADGEDQLLKYSLYKMRSTSGNHKVFVRTTNAGLQTVAATFEYALDLPEDNQWFIYVESPTFDRNLDVTRRFQLDELDSDATDIQDALRQGLDDFFRNEYPQYTKFVDRLESDDYYPYREKRPTSGSKQMLFNRLAYAVEEQYHLLENKNKARQVVFPLLDRVLASGNLDDLAEQVLNLEPDVARKMKTLLRDVDLEQVVAFSDAVARKVKVLDLLNEILYGAPAAYITERKELHKLVERDLWLFGEQYTSTPILISDKSLKTNLEALRNEHFQYEPDKKEDNIEDLPHPSLKLITDLFFFNERVCDDGAREVMVVELKAPSVRLSPKEVGQLRRYQNAIISNAKFPSEKIRYKLYLVGSSVTDLVRNTEMGDSKEEPSLLKRIDSPKRVETHIIVWSDLLERCRQRLTYLGKGLRLKDKEMQSRFDEAYPEVESGDVRSKLVLQRAS